jgi:hypothetical protein
VNLRQNEEGVEVLDDEFDGQIVEASQIDTRFVKKR